MYTNDITGYRQPTLGETLTAVDGTIGTLVGIQKFGCGYAYEIRIPPIRTPPSIHKTVGRYTNRTFVGTDSFPALAEHGDR